MVDILVKVYANMVKEGDFVTDPNGVLKVSEGCFLKYVNQHELNPQQELVGKQIIMAMNEQFTTSVVKKARRLSISMKRKPEIEETEKEVHKTKQSKKGKNSPHQKHKK